MLVLAGVLAALLWCAESITIRFLLDASDNFVAILLNLIGYLLLAYNVLNHK